MHQPLWEVDCTVLTRAKAARHKDDYALFTRRYYIDLTRGHVEREVVAQLVDATLISVAILRYRASTGDWPASLSDLTLIDLPDPAIDRLTGEPLRYVVRDGQPTLYSVGPDLSDDGGHAGWPQARQAGFPEDRLDLLAQLVVRPDSDPGFSGDWVLWTTAPREAPTEAQGDTKEQPLTLPAADN